MAASRTKCCGPELKGRGQLISPPIAVLVITSFAASGESPRSVKARRSVYTSTWAVPATSHRRKRSLSGWRSET